MSLFSWASLLRGFWNLPACRPALGRSGREGVAGNLSVSQCSGWEQAGLGTQEAGPP